MEDVLFIVNPISGKGKKEAIVAGIRARGGEVVYTEHPGHAEEIARACTQGTVVAVGGDGTVNEVARGLLGTGKTLGIIPCGSGDGLALHLGISRRPARALDVIMEGKTRTVDCGEIDGRPFFSVCGVGLDADVSRNFAESGSRGLMTYVREALRVWRGFEPVEYCLEIDGQPTLRKAVLITAANSDQWGNNARIAPAASCSDGLLDVIVLKPFRSIEIPLLALQLMTGRLDKSRRYECLRCRRLVVSRLSEGPAHFDGDYFQAGARVEIGLVSQKLKVLVP